MRKPPPAKPGEVNYGFLDRFTLAHFAIGCAYGLLQMPFALAAFLAVGWEVVENPLKVAFPRIFPHGTADTMRNIIGDIIAVIGGWLLASLILGRAL